MKYLEQEKPNSMVADQRRLMIGPSWPYWPDERYCAQSVADLIGANSERLMAHLCGTEILVLINRGGSYDIVPKGPLLPGIGQRPMVVRPDRAHFERFHRWKDPHQYYSFHIDQKSYRGRKIKPYLGFVVSFIGERPITADWIIPIDINALRKRGEEQIRGWAEIGRDHDVKYPLF